MSNGKKNGLRAYSSWGLVDWPEHIWPHTAARAKYLTRTHRQALLDCGALTRIGRALVFVGDNYMRWLQSNRSRVDNFDIPPNQKKHK